MIRISLFAFSLLDSESSSVSSYSRTQRIATKLRLHFLTDHEQIKQKIHANFIHSHLSKMDMEMTEIMYSK